MTKSCRPSAWWYLVQFVLFLALFLSAYFVFVFSGNALGVFYDLSKAETAFTEPDASLPNPPVFILDAGHGGMDSGAVAKDGTREKDINLSLTQKVGDFLSTCGAQVIYTRREDVLLESPNAPTKKSGDLLARVKLAREHPDALFVSLHMNKFPQGQYRGLQVFYSPNHPQSAQTALTLQQNVILYLQPDNNREAKRAGGEIFVLDRLQSPAILVECGFLSNEDELALLKDEEYQNALAYVIAQSLMQSATESVKE